MVLCDAEIRAAIRSKQILISPEPEMSRYTTSSVDLSLGKEFKRWRASSAGFGVTIDPAHDGYNYADLASQQLELCPLESDSSVTLRPKDFILGITEERVELPEHSRIAARVEGRSSLGRIGLGVHVTAPTIHSGFRGKITLEITNHGAYQIKLRPGMVICQLIFEQVFGTPSSVMEGAFQDQTSVSGKS